MEDAVFITSCHVSDQWNGGPAAAQRTTETTAAQNAGLLPVQRLTAWARRSPRLTPVRTPRRLSLRSGPRWDRPTRGSRRMGAALCRSGTTPSGSPILDEKGPRRAWGDRDAGLRRAAARREEHIKFRTDN